jgi:hypothetical protein
MSERDHAADMTRHPLHHHPSLIPVNKTRPPPALVTGAPGAATPHAAELAFEPPRLGRVTSPVNSQLMFVLDTNVVSELRKARSGEANQNVVNWANSVPAPLLLIFGRHRS